MFGYPLLILNIKKLNRIYIYIYIFFFPLIFFGNFELKKNIFCLFIYIYFILEGYMVGVYFPKF